MCVSECVCASIITVLALRCCVAVVRPAFQPPLDRRATRHSRICRVWTGKRKILLSDVGLVPERAKGWVRAHLIWSTYALLAFEIDSGILPSRVAAAQAFTSLIPMERDGAVTLAGPWMIRRHGDVIWAEVELGIDSFSHFKLALNYRGGGR